MADRRGAYLIPLILTALLVLTVYGVHRVLQAVDGPVRSVVYVPGSGGQAGFWVLLDTLPGPAKRFTAYLHSRMPFRKDPSASQPGESARTSLVRGGKTMRIISLNGGKQEIVKEPRNASNPDSAMLTITGSGDKLLTLLLPGSLSDPEPRFETFNSGRTHLFTTGRRRALIHLGPDTAWSVPELGIASNSPFLVATWESDSSNAPSGLTALLGRNQSRMTWRGDSIRIQDASGKSQAGGFGVWHDGSVVLPLDVDTSLEERKAEGLVSRRLNVHDGLKNPGNYAWRYAAGLADRRSGSPGARASYFLPESLLASFKSDSLKWAPMLNAYRSVTPEKDRFFDFPENRAPFVVAYTAFVARAEGDPRLKDLVVKALSGLDSSALRMDSFSEFRANYGWWYLTAYDVLSPLLTDAERKAVQAGLRTYLRPILRDIPFAALNATSLVLKSTIGLAGLLLEEPGWVEMMVNHLDWYLDFGVREGISYEGNHVLGIGFAYIPVFMDALNRAGVGGPDFFTDERYQSLVASLLMQVSPKWDYPCFEDCFHDGRLNEFIAVSGRGFERSLRAGGDPRMAELASMCRWVEKNGKLPSGYDWLPDMPLYQGRPVEPTPPSFAKLGKWMKGHPDGAVPGFVKHKGGSVILRSGWEAESDLFVLSAKNYEQAHTHMDELSFELWALGENWISNPEYTGFAVKNHYWLTTTKASNSLTVDGHEQVNQKGGRITRAALSEGLQYVEADGTSLYRHPDRRILVKLAVVVAFVIGLMWALALITSRLAVPRFPPSALAAAKPRSKSVAALERRLVVKSMILPFIGKPGLKRLSSAILENRGNRSLWDGERIGIWVQSALLGTILCLVTICIHRIVMPFISLYARDPRYNWMQPILDYAWMLFPIAFVAGGLLVGLNYLLLEALRPKPASIGENADRMLRKILRVAYADASSLTIIAITAAIGVHFTGGSMRFSLVGASPDPWNFQSHLCSYLSKPVLIMVLFLFLKLAVQILVARKYALMLFFITGDRRWYRYGLGSALIAISFKKVVWVTACFAGLLILLAMAGKISAEMLTIYR